MMRGREESSAKQRSPVAAETERVVLFPGGHPGGVVVAAALAETTVLRCGEGGHNQHVVDGTGS